MIPKFLIILFSGLFLLSCSKKDETTEGQTNQTQTQQQVQKNQTADTVKSDAIQKSDETLKQENKKKEDEDLIKKEAEKKKREEIEKKEQKTKEAENIDFAPIWAKKCVKCHGKDGKGKVEGIPDITLPETKSKSEKKLISIITNVVKAETEDGEDMPSWRGKLTESEIIAAAKYVKGL